MKGVDVGWFESLGGEGETESRIYTTRDSNNGGRFSGVSNGVVNKLG